MGDHCSANHRFLVPLLLEGLSQVPGSAQAMEVLLPYIQFEYQGAYGVSQFSWLSLYFSKLHVPVTQGVLSHISCHSPAMHDHVSYSVKNPGCLYVSAPLPVQVSGFTYNECLDLTGESLSSALLSLLQPQVVTTSYSLKAWSTCGVLLILLLSACLAHRC